MNRHKKVNGQLLDIETHQPLVETDIPVGIRLVRRNRQEFEYRLFIAIDSYRPELDGKRCILKLGKETRGEVFLAIEGIPSRSHTRFRVYLQDDVWNNVDWFESLE